MFLNKISLSNFRNFDFRTFDFEKNLNIISGPNASGKTSLIEAICYSCLGKSLRNINTEKNLINYKKSLCNISAFFKTEAENLSVSFYIYRDKGKKILLLNNENKAIRIQNKQWFSKILFIPCMSVENEIFFKSYYLNRDLNIILSLISEEYKQGLINLRSGLKKYRLLNKQNFKNSKYLNILKSNILKANKIILSSRLDCIKTADYYFNNLKRDFKFLNGTNLKYINKYKYNAERDKIIFLDNNRPLLKNFSTAMLKILLILYKVSLGYYILKKTKRNPIIFFDEILSSLDIENKKKIINFLNKQGFQIFLTDNNTQFLLNGYSKKNLKIIYLKK